MPELPDITIYLEALRRRVLGQTIEKVRLISPFVVRSARPALSGVVGRRVVGDRRIGKRVVLELEGGWALVFHLMIAGRFQWKSRGAAVPKKLGLLALDFTSGTLLLTEASTKKRASLHVVDDLELLGTFDPGGIDVLSASLAEFTRTLRSERHTLKRSLTDPSLFSGIGNAYSDEILHRAKLSPTQLSTNLDDAEVARLLAATHSTLIEWTDRLRAECGNDFPSRVTAFRPEMGVHGKFGEPCPVCGSIVQRIVHAENETNYCARCQTGGKLLADRALSKLLKADWPRTLEEQERLYTDPPPPTPTGS